MTTYTQILYQVVFSTKYRKAVLYNRDDFEALNAYIVGILKNKRCLAHEVNGVEDHIHILFELHPSIALADLVKDIKLATSDWIKSNARFSQFSNWQIGYGAFTYSFDRLDQLKQYIKNQEIHHKTESSYNEMLRLLKARKIDFDVNYFE